MIDRRTKMVSVRISWKEYRTYLEACPDIGVRSLSELARAGMQQLVSAQRNGSSAAEIRTSELRLTDEIRGLRDQVSFLSREVDRLSHRVDPVNP